MSTHRTVIESDQPIEVQVKGDGRWFRLFAAVVESGAWHRLSPSAAKVLVVLAKFANDSWLAWPGITTIQGRAGVSRASVYRAVDELEAAGLLLRRRRSGGRGLVTVYQLLEPAFVGGLWVGGEGRPNKKGLTRETKRVSPVRPELDQGTRPAAGGETSEVGSVAGGPGRGSAAAAGGCPVREALAACGVGEPAASELVGAGVTVDQVQRVGSRARSAGKGPGVVVLDLRAEVAGEAARVADLEAVRERRRAAESAKREAERQREAEAEREREALERVRSMTESERAELIAAVAGSLPAEVRRAIRGESWEASPLLRGAVLARVQGVES